ncbi:hypothetical protein [Sphingobium sp. MK2]|uniref:hypothetical protein n=1 Tax=Sphingobium sp. MK2 TaxID=3116540 RepID=UPI0032E36375
MAFDASEIERLRAAVPDLHRPPRNAGGLLSHRFEAHVDPVHETGAARDSELERHNLGMAFLADVATNPDTANPNFRLAGGLAAVRAIDVEKRQREEQDAWEFALDQYRADLDRKLAALDAELAAIDKRLEEIRQRQEAIGEQMEALDELTRLKRSGKFDPNNPAHLRLARNAGLSPDEIARMDAADLTLRRQALDRENGNLEEEWNERMKRRGEIVKEREAVVEARAEIEHADTAEARILAERRAATVLGAQQLGEAAYQTHSTQAKQIAAEAVAGNETETVREDSQAYNRRATMDSGEAMDQRSDFELGGEGSKIISSLPKPS